jgi:putative transposase
LEERKTSWETSKKSIRVFDQIKTIVEKKTIDESLKNIHSQVLQQVGIKIDLAFQAFFRRIKSDETPGYPRFKGKRRYHSLCYPQWGAACKIVEDNLHLSKIGDIYIKLHRPLEGVPKSTVIKRSSTGKWFVTISCELPNLNVNQPLKRIVGLDVGILKFATISDGTSIDNPRFFEKDQKALTKAQRLKKYKVARTIHERIANRRHNFIHQETAKLLERYDCVVVEDIDINQLKEKHWCSKQISDAAWGQFISGLFYKAESAGKKIIKANPAYTSQDCSKCHHRSFKKLADRTHHCECCGLTMDRDLNAALNILALGLDSLGVNP